MIEVLKETDFTFLGEKKTGKVRDIYIQPDPSSPSGQGRLVLISTDRHSSFDRIIAHIPWKGQGLNQISAGGVGQRKKKGEGKCGGVTLREGMKKNQKLPVPVFDPTTKEEGHDRTITPEQMISEGLITKEVFDEVREAAATL